MFRKKMAYILFWLLVWQFFSMAVDNAILLASPLKTFHTLLVLLTEKDFWKVAAASFLRIGTGFFAGFFSALVLAGLSARFSFLEELLKPFMALLKTIPVASFVVILLIWWGSSFLAVAICFLVVLPNIYINTLEGIKSTDQQLLEMAQVFRVPCKNRFFYIYRPAIRPFLYGSMQVSLGMGWKSGVAAEVIGLADFSIGGQLYLSKISLDTAGVFAWTAVVILLSTCFEKLVLYFTGCFFTWEPRCKEAVTNTETASAGRAASVVCEKIYKSFRKQMVIQDFSAQYMPGEIYYLTEPSGSGKTTLLRLICGLEKPDRGRIEGNGCFAMMFQEDRLCEEYSAVRNVEMVTGDRKLAKQALLQLLDKEALEKPCSQLSGGMKRRVALVRAMEAKAETILLDEPFTGMDEEVRRMAVEYIRRKQGDRIVIMATHIL